MKTTVTITASVNFIDSISDSTLLHPCMHVWTILFSAGLVMASQNSLVETHGCVCSGDRLSYKCSVVGVEPRVGTTAWRGSALAVLCSQGGGEIVLHHRSFNEGRNCGNIVVRGIQEDSGCYTSQLNVTVDPSLDNKTVECIYSNGTTTTVIETSSIEITKGA